MAKLTILMILAVSVLATMAFPQIPPAIGKVEAPKTEPEIPAPAPTDLPADKPSSAAPEISSVEPISKPEDSPVPQVELAPPGPPEIAIPSSEAPAEVPSSSAAPSDDAVPVPKMIYN